MQDLSIAQEYLLCSLNDKGGFSSFSTEQPACFVAAALLDLLNNDFVEMQKKNLVVRRPLEPEYRFLAPMVEYIQKSRSMTIKKIVEGYSLSTGKNLKVLLQTVKGALVTAGCASEINKPSLFNRSRKQIVLNKDCRENVIQKIRAELLENGTISEETVALAALLNKAGLIKQYFSKHESQELNNRLKEIKASAPGKMIQQMLDYIDEVVAMLAAVTVMSGGGGS